MALVLMKLEQIQHDLAVLEEREQWQDLLDRIRMLMPLVRSRSVEEAHLFYLRGKSLVGLRNYEEAREALNLSLLLAPCQFHAHYLLGYCFAKDRLWLDALWCQRRSCGLQPRFPDAWYEQGRAAIELGDTVLAVTCLSRAVDLSPEWIGAKQLLQLALSLQAFADGGAKAAASVMRQALSSGLAAQWVIRQWAEMAGSYFLANDLDQARFVCEALLQSPLGLVSYSLPFPSRFAATLLVLIDLACLDQDRLQKVSCPLLRSTLWLPVCQAEIDLWHSIIEPVLRIVELRMRGRQATYFSSAICVIEKLPFAVKQEIRRLRLGGEKYLPGSSRSDSIFIDLKDGLWDISQIDALPELLHRCKKYVERYPRNGSMRRCLDEFLDSLSNIMLDRPNRLVAVPGQEAQALALRDVLLGSLLDAEAIFTSLDDQPFLECGKSRLRRFLLVANQDLPQCVLYRVEQKIWQLQRLGYETRLMWREELEDWRYTKDLLWADSVIVCRMPAVHSVLRLIQAAKRFGCVVFYDIDDLLFDSEYCPPALSTYAGTISPILHRRFILDVPLFRSVIQVCDALLVSTSTLACRWREASPNNPKNVFVLPNMAPPALLSLMSPPNEIAPHGPLWIVFASGTTAHKQAWREELAPAMFRILQQNPLLHIDLVGRVELPDILVMFQSRIRCRPATDYSSYLRYLRQADIGVVVLESGIYTDSKSAIRWMEFSLLGVPSIVSPTAAYVEILEDGKDVLFARGISEWLAAVQRLIDDPILRYTLACNAQSKAQKLFGVHQADRCWTEILDNYGSKVVESKSHLLVVNVFFAPQSVGGATRVAQDQVQKILEVAGDRYEVTVLCADEHPWQGDESLGADFDLTIDCHAWRGARVVRLSLPGRPWSYHMDAIVERFCREWFKDECFDLIHAHSVQVLSAAPLKVARDMGIPYVVTLHDAWWLSPSMFLTTASGLPVDPVDPLGHHENPDLIPRDQLDADLERRRDLFSLLASAKARLAVSRPFSELYVRSGVAHVDVLENDWTPMNCLERNRRDLLEPLRICFVGGMSLHKGYGVLQAAVHGACLSECGAGAHLTIIDSRLEDEDESYMLDWSGTPVSFVPPVAMSAMSDFYAQQDVLLAPSIWPESYGLVTREALSAGLWVVASSIGALAEPIQSGINGHVVPPNDPDALGAVLQELCVEHPRPRPLLQSPNTPSTTERLLAIYQRCTS